MKTKFLNILRILFIYSPFETALVYFTSGSIFGFFISKVPANHYQYEKPSFRKIKRNNMYYSLDISDIIDWYIYYGFAEQSKERFLNKIKENDTVIDFGANIGEYLFKSCKYCR